MKAPRDKMLRGFWKVWREICWNMKGGGFYNVLVQIDNIHHDYDHSSLFANCKVGLCQIASAGKGKV